jgi:hypothetical protein
MASFIRDILLTHNLDLIYSLDLALTGQFATAIDVEAPYVAIQLGTRYPHNRLSARK